MKVHESVQGNFACHETTRQIELLIKIVITLQETTYTSNTCVNRESTELLARSNFNTFINDRFRDLSSLSEYRFRLIEAQRNLHFYRLKDHKKTF